ncbi:cyclohexanone monooxygenase [Endozoicomonas sp. OPT23]|uniref:flavin-containing monooxygenase n=1 Tax=Endozoicomonas sp. OPT23 TaxID=2072845 RepID=UPI00129A96DA|nr:NAD(P)/FAD-dependent oxidoreductase [Endozoicomonas sp. OPT23]MRI34463.1 cyclohexanone monooxygenase [Endozoicomonas sp. OPT23]
MIKKDVIVVGAGFAGMQLLHHLRREGFNALILESASEVGGTWFHNRYPGCRCDVESMQYSYQFDKELEQEWKWTELYPSQPEILEYAKHVASRFDLKKDIQFNTRVQSAEYRKNHQHWLITTTTGEQFQAQFCIMATGNLSVPNTPRFNGLEDFKGEVYHTARWPEQPVDFTGKRVAVIGTGSSGIQAIPVVAEQARQLTVFQRSASYSLPAGNRPLSTEEINNTRNNYQQLRDKASQSFGGVVFKGEVNEQSVFDVSETEQQAEFEQRWQDGGVGFTHSYSDLLLNSDANEIASEFIRNKIRTIVKDKTTAELLCPTDLFACKRPCIDTNYYDTYNRDNVSLVSIKDNPIECFTEKGLITDNTEYQFDALILATGFDAMTGAVRNIKIEGNDQQRLDNIWSQGSDNYLGLAVHGFPNLFTVTGPGSPSVLTNVMVSIHQHVNWITDCISYMRTKQLGSIEATIKAQTSWLEQVNTIAGYTLYPSCNSWYLGANIPSKPRQFMPYAGGVPGYRQICQSVVENDYEGFQFQPAGSTSNDH